MNLELLPLRRLETADRRVLGAFQFVDALTTLPLGGPATIAVRGATIDGAPIDVALHEHTVRIRQNRGGRFVVFSAPLFETYTSTFNDPLPPAETAAHPLRLQLAVTDAGPYYLPQGFAIDLPRPLDPAAPNSVLAAITVGLFRAPSAPVQPGWAVLRVRVTQSGTSPEVPLPGVLVRVFRRPRAAADQPIGAGVTDWRGGIAGEACVPVIGLQRFRPGAGANVIDTDQAIEFEAARHTTFTGAAGQLPDVSALLAATGSGLVQPPSQPPGSQLEIVQPATPPPMRVQAGREYVVHLAMP